MLIIGTVAPIEGPEKFERIEVEAGSYEAGRGEVEAQVPEGWRLTSFRTER